MSLASLSTGNLAYLIMVVVGFVSFMVVLGGTWIYVNLGAGKAARRTETHKAAENLKLAAE